MCRIATGKILPPTHHAKKVAVFVGWGEQENKLASALCDSMKQSGCDNFVAIAFDDF